MAGVSYNVPLVAQIGTNTCWYACAQMLLSWRSQQYGRAGAPIMDNAVDEAAHKLNERLDPGFFEAFFVQTLHMQLEHAPLGRENVVVWLRRYGPLIYSGRYNGYRGLAGWVGHAVVITGAEINNLAASVGINDPGPHKIGSRLVMNLDELARTLPFAGPVAHC
jgi:hypothetical protein